MVETSYSGVAERFINEKLASHWQVTDSKESFERLLEHISRTTNFKPYFEEAFSRTISHFSGRRINVLDLGSGVSWTSAVMANNPNVEHVFAVEPSDERLKYSRYIFYHFGVPEGKITTRKGTFTDFDLPKKVDLAVLCASFHHCYDEDTDGLFAKLKTVLSPGGIILLANEHYVDYLFSFKRLLSCVKGLIDKKDRFFSFSNLRSPLPDGAEHWRMQSELKNIFGRNGFDADFYVFKGDLCKSKTKWKIGFHYYYAILKRKVSEVIK